MKRFVLILSFLFFVVVVNAQIVQWTFEGVTLSATASTTPSITSGSAQADAGTQTAGSVFTGLHTSASTAWSTPAGNGSAKSLSSNNWAVGDYYQFLLSTIGYNNINISFAATSSATGPRDFTLQYSTDGSSFTDFTTYAISNIVWSLMTPNSSSVFSFDLSALVVIQNASTVYIRLRNHTATSASGGTVGTGGTSRIDNFTVTGTLISSSTDYFRSVTSGNWNSPSTWEQSPDNVTWSAASTVPNSLANTITIRNTHTVTLTVSTSADQVVIENGGTLVHSGGTFTIADGTGDDIDVQNGGIFALSSTAPLFSPSTSTANIATGGTLRVAAAGLTGAGAGVNANNYLYQHQSILEYTLSGGFASSGVTFFPNALAGTIPIFRVTASSPSVLLVGAGTNTTFNGLFELSGTATVLWQNSGDRIFRNGIRNTGIIDYEAASIGSGKFIINGTTAELGGTGLILVPTTGGLEIGSGTTVTLTSNKTVTGNITLLNTNSIIEIGNNNLTVSGTVTNSEVSSYVKTNGTGKLTLNNVANFPGGKLFPIGLTSINPLYIFGSTTANYSARVVEPITPAIFNDNNAVLRTWNISSSVTSPNATISFGYTFPTDCGPGYSNAAVNSQIGVNVSGVWNVHQSGLSPVAFTYPNTYIITPNPINTFTDDGTEYPFVIASNGSILSADFFINASAQKRNVSGIISWKVLETGNVNSFEVQRSVNNSDFQTIARIDPATNQTDYTYTDANPGKGTNLYRIKVNRNSGGVRFSNTVAIIFDSKWMLITSIAPNPVQHSASITLSAASQGGVDFKVYNVSGNVVKQWHSNITEGNNTINMHVAALPAGTYHVLASTIDTRTAFRFIKL